MNTIEVRLSVDKKWRLALTALVAIGLFYYYFGYLPMPIWILGGAVLVALPFSLLRRNSEDPCIVLDDRGVFDHRLRVGLIQWADIKRVYTYSLHGVPYVCLDLHELQKYEARRPLSLRLLSNVQRVFGMSPIAISAGSLDMETGLLVRKIQEGCQAAQPR
jgi:hypothetical protein